MSLRSCCVRVQDPPAYLSCHHSLPNTCEPQPGAKLLWVWSPLIVDLSLLIHDWRSDPGRTGSRRALESKAGFKSCSMAVCQASLPRHTPPSASAGTCRHPEHTWSPLTSNLKLPLLSESPRASDTATVTQPHPKALPERPQLQRRAELPRTRPFPSSLQQHTGVVGYIRRVQSFKTPNNPKKAKPSQGSFSLFL